MDRHTLPARDVAYDRLAANRVAAFCPVGEQVAGALDLEAVPRPARPGDGGGAGCAVLAQSVDPRIESCAPSPCRSRRPPPDPRSCRSRARGRPSLEIFRRARDDHVKRRASLSRSLADLDRARCSLAVDQVADLVARARRLDDLSQSLLGLWPGWVRISTMSPFFRL